MDRHITLRVFSDYVCPWCYLNAAALEALAAQENLAIRYLAFPLNPGIPDSGRLLSEIFGDRDMSASQAHLEQRLRDAGVPYHYSERTYNTRKAQELAKWVETKTPEDRRIHMALFQRYFVQGENLADIQVLKQVAASLDFSADEAEDALVSGRFGDAVDRDWQKARTFQISGVPTMLAEGYLLNGCQTQEDLQRFTAFLRDKHATAPADPQE